MHLSRWDIPAGASLIYMICSRSELCSLLSLDRILLLLHQQSGASLIIHRACFIAFSRWRVNHRICCCPVRCNIVVPSCFFHLLVRKTFGRPSGILCFQHTQNDCMRFCCFGKMMHQKDWRSSSKLRFNVVFAKGFLRFTEGRDSVRWRPSVPVGSNMNNNFKSKLKNSCKIPVNNTWSWNEEHGCDQEAALDVSVWNVILNLLLSDETGWQPCYWTNKQTKFSESIMNVAVERKFLDPEQFRTLDGLYVWTEVFWLDWPFNKDRMRLFPAVAGTTAKFAYAYFLCSNKAQTHHTVPFDWWGMWSVLNKQILNTLYRSFLLPRIFKGTSASAVI